MVFNTVCECVTAVTGVNDIDKTKTRLRHVSRARQFVVWVMLAEIRELITYTQLGHLFTHTWNHSTIVHSKNTIDDLLAVDRDTRETMTEVAQLLAAHGYERTLVKLQTINIIR